jgi:hypothetical protein
MTSRGSRGKGLQKQNTAPHLTMWLSITFADRGIIVN